MVEHVVRETCYKRNDWHMPKAEIRKYEFKVVLFWCTGYSRFRLITHPDKVLSFVSFMCNQKLTDLCVWNSAYPQEVFEHFQSFSRCHSLINNPENVDYYDPNLPTLNYNYPGVLELRKNVHFNFDIRILTSAPNWHDWKEDDGCISGFQIITWCASQRGMKCNFQ